MLIGVLLFSCGESTKNTDYESFIGRVKLSAFRTMVYEYGIYFAELNISNNLYYSTLHYGTKGAPPIK